MTGADPFEAFVRRHQDLVFTTAVRLLGSVTEAEDVAKLGQNRAVWSMGATGIYIPAGLVKSSAVARTSSKSSR